MGFLLKQGEDLIAEIIVIDEDNKKVNLTNATKMRIGLYVRGTNVFKYVDEVNELPIIGYGHCEINSINNYQIDVFITREQSASFPIGDVIATVLLEFPDIQLTDKRLEYSYSIGSIEKGLMKLEVL